MRSRGLWVPLVLWAQLLAQACGAPPSGGGPCSSDALTCDGSHGVFACIAGAWVSVPCEGPGGCTGAGSTLECDTSVATPGSRCPPWKAGQTQCLKNPVAVLQCVDSTWKMTSPCTQCMVKSGKAQCHEPTGCGPSNCAGCCSADQCLAPPLNVTANTCGAGGGACQDCQALGMVCAAASATCEAASAPCSDASESGQCVSSTVVRFCSLPSGLGTPAVQAYTCAAGTTCLSGGNGATCRSAAATCRDGETRCSGQTALESCTTSGTWAGSTCAAGCRGSAVGGYCPPATATTTLTGKLTYLSRGPNARRPTGWTTAAAVPAYNVAVVVQAANGLWVDVAVTGRDGRYSIKVPTAPAAGDRLFFIAFGGDGLGVTFAVMDPQLPAGSYSPTKDLSEHRVWSWSFPISGLVDGATFSITEAQGSAALNLFDVLQTVYAANVARHQGSAAKSVTLWFGLDVIWTCGACFLDAPGQGYDSQVFFSGDDADLSYWSDAVTAHELGHWAMATWGTSPGEGGTHLLGVPTFPGQAWSEGWATYHSSFIRNDPVYFDSSSHGMFWIDLSTRTSSAGALPLSSPASPDGLQQRIDENEVASMLWNLSLQGHTATQQVHNALGSPHMNTGEWPRGYRRHTWDVDVATQAFSNVRVTSQRAPYLADFLDSLRCQGLSRAAIDAVTQPTLRYPYPAQTPLCQAPTLCYGCTSGSSCLAGSATAACGTGGAPCTACGPSQTCNQGVCQ